MSETRGRFNPMKNRLIDLIALSHPVLQPNDTRQHVHGDWKRRIDKQYRHLPVVSVRVNPVSVESAFYGRIFEGGGAPVSGSMADITFSVHVHTSACNLEDDERGKYAQDLAENIIDYLLAQRYNQEVYGISDISDISSRESDIEGQPWKICRVIIRGKMLCKRYDA